MKSLRSILLPFSLIYACITWFRNKFYDWGIKKPLEIPGKSICVGNITVGGTGKSPFTAFLAAKFTEQHPVILSRGYGRATTGLLEAKSTSTAEEIGDEPLMYFNRFQGNVPVIVSEKRSIGVQYIRDTYDDSLIILDDAYQHRAVKSGMNILLMTYDRPVFRDFPFPAGNLREGRSGMKRADLVLVTKSPSNLSPAQKQVFYERIPLSKDKIFFSEIIYGDKKGLFGEDWKNVDEILLVTGIAQPAPLKRFLAEDHDVHTMEFPDHHDFTAADIQRILQKVATFAGRSIALVTTEKDAVRLLPWKTTLQQSGCPCFVQEMTLRFDREQDLIDTLNAYVVRTNEGSR